MSAPRGAPAPGARVLPAGFSISGPREARSGLYRGLGEPRTPTAIEQRWRHQFGCVGAFLVPWGLGFLLFGLFQCIVRDGWRPGPPPFVFGVGLIGVGIAGLYVGLGSLVNATRVAVSISRVTRKIGPLPWRGAASCPRSSAMRVEVRAVRRNDVRNGGWGPSPPERHEVVLTEEGNVLLVLFDQIASRDAAELVRDAVREACDAANA